ncbi:probable fatty acyl-CoA reductase 2 [Coccomyxa sp. Obi]|nr:probable fatty acyl-CoA reductase 2 [Coccomyxa sp. Obi]
MGALRHSAADLPSFNSVENITQSRDLKPLVGEDGPRCRGKSRQSQGSMCREVHARAGDLPLYPHKVQLPPCLAAHEEAVVATTSQPLSVVQSFSYSTVLVTGGTGYLGSLVMEQLLRVVPDMKRIYVIIRSKRGLSAEARLNRLLERSMWHLHRQDGRVRPETAAKIGVIPGDLLLPNCGISGANRRRLTREVDYVIHCAASISFEEHIHTLLTNNYEATRNVADLAAAMGKLRAFVHLSTAYVNCDRPHGSHVEEALYPFDLSACRPQSTGGGGSSTDGESCSSSGWESDSSETFTRASGWWKLAESWWRRGSPRSMWTLFSGSGRSSMQCSGQTREEKEEGTLLRKSSGEINEGAMADVDALAAELMALSPEAASRRVAECLRATNMPNAYFFTKRMAEVLISTRHSVAFPVAIVRPSLVGCTARSPHPGYFGNNAGPTSIALAFALGIATFTSHRADSVFDVIPGDVCSSIILASAAALSQKQRRTESPLVVHACSSTTNPETLYGWWDMGYRYWSASPPPVRLTLGDYPSMDCPRPPVGMSDSSWIFALLTAASHVKFWAISAALRLAGRAALSAKLWSGWQAWRTYNRSALDFNLFFCAAGSQRLERNLPACERGLLPMTWRAGQDSWAPYLRSHFDQIRHLHFRQPGYAPTLEG